MSVSRLSGKGSTRVMVILHSTQRARDLREYRGGRRSSRRAAVRVGEPLSVSAGRGPGAAG